MKLRHLTAAFYSQTKANLLLLGFMTAALHYAPAQSWTEAGDAGDTPTTAQVPAGTGALTEIIGTNSSVVDWDVYRIYINDFATFSAFTTFYNDATVSGEDNRLALFDAQGHGVALNDDGPAGDPRARIYGATTNLNATLPCVTSNGWYYLAVFSYDGSPASGGIGIFPDDPGSNQVGPVLPDAPFDSWVIRGFPNAPFGGYVISLAGAAYSGGSPMPGFIGGPKGFPVTGWDNQFFDINTGSAPIRIDTFSIFSGETALLNYRVYTHAGTWLGTEDSATGWTLMSTTAIQVPDENTQFALPVYVNIPANSTQAFVILTEEGPNSVGGIISGVTEALSNSDLTITTGEVCSHTAPDYFTQYLPFGQDVCTLAGTVIYTRNPVVGPPQITTQPTNVTVLEGGTLELSVAAQGTPPFSYQWRTNGVDIPGATTATYTMLAVPLAAAGSYTVVVTGPAAPPATSSPPAIVTVTPDTTAPALVSAAVIWNQDIVLVFSEQMAPGPATTAGNYSLSPVVAVNGAEISDDQKTVTVHTAGLQAATTYTLTINGLTDTAAARNPLPANTQTNITTVWAEEGDAGDTPGTAQVLAGNGALTGIIGTNSSVVDWDVYRIYINDFATFSAVTTFYNDATVSGADNRLALFDAQGHGVAMNDDSPTDDLRARIYGATTNLNATLPCVTSNGWYYLAVFSYDGSPASSGIGIFPDEGGSNQVGPVLPDASFDSWVIRRFPNAPFGGYAISLTGAAYSDTTAPVVLSITRQSSTTANLTWSGANLSVQQASSLTSGTWTDVPGLSPVTVPLTNNAQYYRLIRH